MISWQITRSPFSLPACSFPHCPLPAKYRVARRTCLSSLPFLATRVLRFGNHERLAHPTDCQKFFSCLRNGHPRAGACPRKTVFSEETGHCADPATVKGWSVHEPRFDSGSALRKTLSLCSENFWKDKLEEGLEYEYYE